MKRAQTVMIVVAVVLFIVSFSYLDWTNLAWRTNSGSYIGLFTSTCIFVSMYFSMPKVKNK